MGNPTSPLGDRWFRSTPCKESVLTEPLFPLGGRGFNPFPTPTKEAPPNAFFSHGFPGWFAYVFPTFFFHGFACGFPARRPVTSRCNRSPTSFPRNFLWILLWFSNGLPTVFCCCCRHYFCCSSTAAAGDQLHPDVTCRLLVFL